VKPFVKRQKNDAADAAAIAEAALRPNLHYVAVKSAEHGHLLPRGSFISHMLKRGRGVRALWRASKAS